MAITLNDLNIMLDEHFRLAPPLDSPNVPVSGAVSEFGSGVSLGDGKSMTGVRGLENIQVFRTGSSTPISMQAWMTRALRDNPNPEAIARSVGELLENGQLAYFEQGREFATRLSLNPLNQELITTSVNRERNPPEKPKRTFFQTFKWLFGQFTGPERVEYDRKMVDYELYRKSIAASNIRAPIGVGSAPVNDDGKGRVLGGAGGNEAELIRNAGLHYERSRLSPADRHAVEHSILIGEKPEEATELKIGPKLNQDKFFQLMYPNGKPYGISTIEDHVRARVARQDSFDAVKTMKDPRYAYMMTNGSGLGFVADALCSVMKGENNSGVSQELDRLAVTQACRALFRKPDLTNELIQSGRIFDQFAKNLVRNPIDGITPNAIENLLNVCIEPHPQLSAALEASKNGGVLKLEGNNKQMEKKQPEKKQPEKKADGPKMGF